MKIVEQNESKVTFEIIYEFLVRMYFLFRSKRAAGSTVRSSIDK